MLISAAQMSIPPFIPPLRFSRRSRFSAASRRKKNGGKNNTGGTERGRQNNCKHFGIDA